MNSLIKLLASFFYLGYTPLIPGTIASSFALIIYLLLQDNFYLYTILLVVLTTLGFLVSGRAEEIFQEKDASKIVLDEVAGLFLAFWTLRLDLTLALVGLIIFRLLDAIKVYPANKLEKLPGALGIMSDDLVAGLYTNVVLQIVTRVLWRWLYSPSPY